MKRDALISSLMVVSAFALGLSVGVPDVETLLGWLCSEPEPPKRGYVGQRLDRLLVIPAQRESTWPIGGKWPSSKPSRTNHYDEELRVFECSEPSYGYAVSQCDCWIYGRCDPPLKVSSRFTTCELKHGIYEDCRCWVYGDPEPDTLCELIHRRDRCEELSGDHRWDCRWDANQRIEEWLGWGDNPSRGSEKYRSRPNRIGDLQSEFHQKGR